MSKVIFICGMLASGKSRYARRLIAERGGVLLSCDELMRDLFDEHLGDRHQEILEKVKAYLFKKAEQIVAAGSNCVLDFGFWGRAERQAVSFSFSKAGIAHEWHYVDVSSARWEENIRVRNQLVKSGRDPSYFVDEGLKQKLLRLFEKPEREEMDVWFVNGDGCL